MAGIPELVGRILEKRGISAAETDDFLSPSIRDLAPARELPNVEAAAEAILSAVRDRRRIVVFGDYDCDGVCATAILVRTLAAFGADVSPFLPERLSEGYGMSEASVARMLAENPGVGLVVTVDNGINSVENIAFLRGKGVDVVVTDHHLPGEVLPDCVVVNPKVSHPDVFENLCGAGVAFLLAGELVSRAKSAGLYSGPSLAGPLLVLAGLATVTDVMPLLGQNRILVAEALNRFDALAPVGLRALFAKAAKRGVARHTSRDFGFLLGPRINAAGRIASGAEALRLVLADDQDEAGEAARIVNGRNDERKSIEQKMLEDALAKVVPGAAAQVIDLPDGHQGVAGIVAARVMERMEPKVPVCVVVGGHGSARAPDGINVRDALAASGDFLDRFGGHAAAAGFSVKAGMVDAFRARFAEVCSGFAAEARSDARDDGVDAWVTPEDLTLDVVGWMSRLEPFGEGNPEPLFGMKDAVLCDIRPLGQEGRHLALTVNGMRGVWWGRGDVVEDLRRGSSASHDVIFTVAESEYGGPHVELRVVEIR